MSNLPRTREEILRTGVADPEFERAWKARGSPHGDMPTDVVTLKSIITASLPDLQQKLAASRPAAVIETEHHVPLSTGFTSRLLVCHTVAPADGVSPPSPVIVLFHGGIHVLGFPEFDLPLARALAVAHNAVVICPSTRKAPETAFPGMLDDAWAVVQAVARGTQDHRATGCAFLPPGADPAAGFLVGGTSSGANFADVVIHLARDAGLAPPLTGAFMACGAFTDPARGVPPPLRERYLSRAQNQDAPVVNAQFMRAVIDAIRPDTTSPLWAPFDWPARPSAEGDAGSGSGHAGLPPVYFQVCGMDINRDDGLVYESVLREEAMVKTRVDLYPGLPHCWWDAYPELEASKKRMADTIEGFGWLLAQS